MDYPAPFDQHREYRITKTRIGWVVSKASMQLEKRNGCIAWAPITQMQGQPGVNRFETAAEACGLLMKSLEIGEASSTAEPMKLAVVEPPQWPPAFSVASLGSIPGISKQDVAEALRRRAARREITEVG